MCVYVCVCRMNLNKKEVHNKWERRRGRGERKRQRGAGRGIECAHACMWKSLHCSLAAEVRKTKRGEE